MRSTTKATYTMFHSQIFTLRITTKCVQMADRQLQEATVVVLESIVCEHHIYTTICTPRLGETLTVQQEQDNDHNRYAVSVVKSEAIVGHVPHHLVKNTWYFLLHGGHITCEVIGKRKKGNGLEVPCTYSIHLQGLKNWLGS